MKLYAGIDGGQSSTRAVIGDECGRVVAAGDAAPSDLVGTSRDSERAARALESALCNALERADLPTGTRFESVVIGLSGYEAGESHPPSLPNGRCARLRVVHDAEIAHAGAFNGASGILILAGTGSVAFGVDEAGRRVRAGGWGYLFGDEGSAFRIARDALADAMQRTDRARAAPLAERALEFFGAETLRGVQLGFAHGEISRARLAAFAHQIVAYAASGSGELGAQARTHLDTGIDALVALSATLAFRLGPFGNGFSYAGGLFESEFVRRRFATALSGAFPAAQLHAPIHSPAAGALRLAIEAR